MYPDRYHISYSGRSFAKVERRLALLDDTIVPFGYLFRASHTTLILCRICKIQKAISRKLFLKLTWYFTAIPVVVLTTDLCEFEITSIEY